MFQLRRAIGTVLLATLPLASCIVPPTGSPQVEQPSAITESSTADTPEEQMTDVPEELMVIEEQAEDIFDFAPRGNWQRINEDITKVQTAWTEWKQAAGTGNTIAALQDAFTRAFDHLQAAVADQDQADTLQAANDLSAAVIDLFDLYQPPIPTDIGRLDVLGRQIILDVAAGDWAKAEQTLASTNEVWSRAKASVLEHQGAEVAGQYDTSLQVQADLLKAKDDMKLTTEANNGLELVDALERVY